MDYINHSMEFADLDDDLFSKERQRNSIDEEYSARFCHHHWFLEVTPDLLVSEEDNLSVAKYSADYFFFKKDYGAAVEKYEGVLSILPVANTTVRRECYEGIARSYIKMGMPNKAVEFAEKMHKTSKTMEQTTVSSSVLIDTNIAAENYPEALSASQLLVSLHPFNSDVWLKLACVYAYLYDIKLTNVNELLFAPFTSKNVTVKRTKCEVDETATVQGAKANLQNASYSIESLEKKILALNTNTCEEELSDCGINCKENELNYQTTFTEEEKGPQFVCACLFRSFLILKRTERTSFGFALDTSLRFQKKNIE